MVWNKIKSYFNRETDPVLTCGVYIDIGCSHVDGFLCDMTKCSIKKRYDNLPQKQKEQYDRDWNSTTPATLGRQDDLDKD